MFLTTMLIEATNWRPERNWTRERISATPDLAHYVTDWPRRGDLGVVAMDVNSQPIGAAWLRLFPEDDPGIGRALLRHVHGVTNAPHISLSVERDNPAINLYRSEGYRTVTSGRDSDTMIRNQPVPRLGCL
jgi:hypothetical protein